MPEELFDLIEELVDDAGDRKRRRRRAHRDDRDQRRDTGPPARYETRDAEPESEGIKGRIGRLIRSSKPAEPAPQAPQDPRAELEKAYRQQRALLEEMTQSVDQVTVARNRLEQQAESNNRRIAEFEDRAREYLQAGHEDRARNALERRRLALVQEEEFQGQIDLLAKEQSDLMQAEARLEAKVESLRTQLTVLSSQLNAAEAQTRAREAASGLSKDFVDVMDAIDRTEKHTAEVRSRGDAIDAMISAGELEGDEDRHLRFEREMELSEVDSDLARLKRELEDPTNRG